MIEKSSNLAVLIDADNTSHTLIASILEEVAKYGDWSSPSLKNWRDKCLNHGLIAIQQFSYTAQKNATDIAMVIDAMDLLHSGKFDGFCLVSSDSDFTGLASRIRKEGVLVYGIGKNNAPEAFRMSCDKYIFTNNLINNEEDKNLPINDSTDPSAKDDIQNIQYIPKPTIELRHDMKLINLIRNAIKEHEDATGWAPLGAIGKYMNKISPEFDSRNYGYAKLSELMQNIGFFSSKNYKNQIYLSNNMPKSELSLITKITHELVAQYEKEDGWSSIQPIGNDLKSKGIYFKVLGYSKLSDFLETIPKIEIKDKKMARIKA